MQTTYTVKHKRIEIDMFNETVPIWFFGDVHRDTKSFDEGSWRRFLSSAKRDADNNSNTLFVGMGDYHDFASSKEKKKLQSGDLHETTMDRFDSMAISDNVKFSSDVSFMRGRLLGLIGGNHGWKLQSGKLADEDLAERLATDYLGWLCHYTIAFSSHNSNKNITVNLVLCHGKAGGKTFGITVTQVGDLKSIFPIADIYCMGHDHQRTAHPVSVLVPAHNGKGSTKIKQKRQFLCRSGSFKRAYCEDEPSYEVGRLLRPADLGALRMEIAFRRDHSDGGDVIVTDISAQI